MVVVFGLDDGDGDVGLVIEDVVGPLGFAPRYELATHDDPALGKGHFLADLQHRVPASPLDGRRDEFGTNVSLAEVFPVHAALFACWQKPRSLYIG